MLFKQVGNGLQILFRGGGKAVKRHNNGEGTSVKSLSHYFPAAVRNLHEVNYIFFAAFFASPSKSDTAGAGKRPRGSGPTLSR